jgi:glutamate dehydrogenase (NADP+)
MQGKIVVSSGSGNVSLYTLQKCVQMGAKVVAMSDSSGYIYDETGIDFGTIRRIKEDQRGRCSDYVKECTNAKYHEGGNIWEVKCDIALPNATQNELDEKDAKMLVDNGVIAVAEGANMPCTPEAVKIWQKNDVLYGPGKAANAGGVAVSGLEMSQNSMRRSWTFGKTDEKLKDIMQNIHTQCMEASEAYSTPGNLVDGSNIAGFLLVANAMKAQGIV